MADCDSTKKEFLRGYTLNDYEHHLSRVTVVHECDLEEGHAGRHICGCNHEWRTTIRRAAKEASDGRRA